MDISLDLIKRIISSDELCDKVNSTEYRNEYIRQIETFILSLLGDVSNLNFNIHYINRYLKKFVINKGTREDKFFNNILLKLYSLNVKNDEFLSILDSIGFFDLKDILIKKYDNVIQFNSKVSIDELKKMLSFYCYVCPKYVLPSSYIDFFTYNLYSNSVDLSYDLMSYFYKSFAYCFADSKGLSICFDVIEHIVSNDPFYDNKGNRVFIYSQNLGDKVDYLILSDIFFQIKYLYLVRSINDYNNKFYSYEQLCLVKEICLKTILGDDYFEKNYSFISFSDVLRNQAKSTVKSYFSKLGLSIDIIDSVDFKEDIVVSDDEDVPFSVGILFDLVLRRENPNLLIQLIKNYPILGCEYRKDKKKSLLTILLDIYSNRKLLNSFNKDLLWYRSKLGSDDEFINGKIDKLNHKISVCSSYINVMSLLIKEGDMISDDIVRSISDLITYNTDSVVVKNDIYSILNFVIPKKISNLCSGRNSVYRENLRKRIIKCYIDSMGLIRNSADSVYFMRLYSSLEKCIKSIDVD